jgi:membrane-associated phospholipid phosphatase
MTISQQSLLYHMRSFLWVLALSWSSGALWLWKLGKEPLFLKMNSWHYPWADAVAPWLTHLGDGLTGLVLLLLLLLVSYRQALLALACFAGVLLVTQVGKQLIFADALRPLAYFAALDTEIRTLDSLTIHLHNSFPSGHSAAIFGLCTFLALQFAGRLPSWLWLCLAWPIAYTRVYLAQHFWGDVLAGALLGSLTVLVIYLWLSKKLDSKPKAWQQYGLLNSFQPKRHKV